MPDVNIDIPFGKLDTKTDPAILPNGGLTQAVNVTTQTNGVYKKRFGYSNLASLSSGAPILATHNGALLGIDSSKQLSVYSPTGTKWNANAKANPAQVTRQQVSRNASTTTSTDVAYLSGYYAVVFVQSGTATIVIIDSATGMQTSSTTVSSVRDGARILPLGTGFILLYSDSGTANRISYFRFSPTAGFLGTGSVVLDQSGTCFSLDACTYDANNVLLAYGTTGNTVKLVNINNALTVTTKDTYPGTPLAGSTGPVAVLSTATNESIYILLATSANVVHARVLNAGTFAATAADFVAYSAVAAVNALAVGRLSSSSAVFLIQVHATAAVPDVVARTAWTSAGVSAGTNGALNGVWLAAKPFVVGSKMYAPCYYPAVSYVSGALGIQATYFLCDVHSDTIGVATGSTTVVARAAFQSASATRGSISASVSAAGTLYSFAGTLQLKLPDETTPFQGAVDLIGFDFAYASLNLPVEGARSTDFASGAPQTFDGLAMRTWGYDIFPESPKLTASGVGGSMVTGDYLYKLCYERVDGNGDTVWSSPSLPVKATIGPAVTTGSVSVQFLYDWYTLASTELPAQGVDVDRVGIYRTAVGGTQYFKIGEVANISTNTAVVTFTDTFADASITANAQLYTNGGKLEREPPAAALQFVWHQNACFYVSAEDRSQIFFSTQYVVGEQPWFSQALGFRVDAGGDITALASFDDKLVIFKADRIFYVTGQVPNATGGNDQLSDPQIVSSDCGCIEPRSVVVTPIGIMFLSAKGIYMLDRGLQVQYVGSPVDSYLSPFPTCTSAVMLTDRREVRFTMAGVDTGVTLVYNYDADAWTVFSMETIGVIAVSAAQSSIGYVWLGQNGVPRVETQFQNLDADGSYISMTLETGWIKVAGLQGLGRVRRALFLLDPIAPYRVSISVASGYDSTYAAPKTFSFSGAPLPFIWSLQLASMKSEAWRFLIVDSVNGITGSAAFAARALTLEARVKPGSASRILSAGQKG